MASARSLCGLTHCHSAGILKQLSRKFVANLARIKDETVFNDSQRYPDAPYAMVSRTGEGADIFLHRPSITLIITCLT